MKNVIIIHWRSTFFQHFVNIFFNQVSDLLLQKKNISSTIKTQCYGTSYHFYLRTVVFTICVVWKCCSKLLGCLNFQLLHSDSQASVREGSHDLYFVIGGWGSVGMSVHPPNCWNFFLLHFAWIYVCSVHSCPCTQPQGNNQGFNFPQWLPCFSPSGLWLPHPQSQSAMPGLSAPGSLPLPATRLSGHPTPC